MNQIQVSTGDQYGRLVVIRELSPKIVRGHRRRSYRQFVCRCECGNKKIARLDRLRDGRIQSCGCLKKESIGNIGKETATHGLSQHPIYPTWSSMHGRCSRANNNRYHRYGGRGISVCPEWNDVQTFLDWAVLNGWKPGLQIDRKDNDGDYCPSNCRFVSSKENNRNRPSVRQITFSGTTKPLQQWADEVGISASTIASRIKMGWSVGDALTKPVRRRSHG